MAKEQNDNRIQWYVVSTQSGKEHEVKQNIDNRIVSMGMEEYILKTFIAEEEVPVLRKGEPTGKTKMKNLYPRYLFVRMIMTDEAWYVIRNTPGVTGFIGSSGKGTKPTPVPKEQMGQVLKYAGIYDEAVVSKYKVGDKIRVLKGIYVNREGEIIAVDADNSIVSVAIEMIGGRTATGQFPFSDVQII